MQITALAYVVVHAAAPESWVRYGEDVLGMKAARLGDDVALKMDERAGRIFVQRAAADRYAASGWEVANKPAFQAAIAELVAAGVEIFPGTPAEIALRHVADMVWFLDPSNNRHEICWGYVSDFARFVSPEGVEGFVTGELGLGHMVLPAPAFEETRAFMHDVLGFGLSDIMVHRPEGQSAQRIDFMHCGNGRHHSLALFEGDVPSGCVHLMVEAATIDEIGRAMDRAARHKVPLMATLGRHVNDHMISFYIQSPGGFAIEYGYGGRVIDWDRHTVFETTAASLWGHDFSVGFGAADASAPAAAPELATTEI